MLIWCGLIRNPSRSCIDSYARYLMFRDKLKITAYGTPEYKALLDGKDGMSLVEFVEVFYGWEGFHMSINRPFIHNCISNLFDRRRA